jgi:hypothetical protein
VCSSLVHGCVRVYLVLVCSCERRGREEEEEELQRVAAPTFGIRASCVRGSSLHRRQAVSRAKEEGVLPGKSRHRQQGGDGHGAEVIAMKRSPSMCESSTWCVIDDNMKVRHRRVASPVMNMEASHRRGAARAANMRQRVRHGGVLVVKA